MSTLPVVRTGQGTSTSIVSPLPKFCKTCFKLFSCWFLTTHHARFVFNELRVHDGILIAVCCDGKIECQKRARSTRTFGVAAIGLDGVIAACDSRFGALHHNV